MSASEVVGAGRMVSVRYILSLDNGEVVEASPQDEPLEYLHGAGHVLPGLEKALEGKTPGDRMTVTVPPDEGFGPHVPEAVRTVAREVFPASADLAPGLVFRGVDHAQEPVYGTVKAIEGDRVVVDFNHPLAGRALQLEVEVAAVREATPDEQRRAVLGDAAELG